MRELLRGYLDELDWGGGVTKDDLMAHLAGRDDALRTAVNEYIAEGTYASPDMVMTLIPAQAWQDTQGDAWRGPQSLLPDDVPSNFRDGAVGGDRSNVSRAGGPGPQTPGLGRSAVGSGGGSGRADGTTASSPSSASRVGGQTGAATGTGGFGDAGSNAGESDPGIPDTGGIGGGMPS